MNLLIDQPPKTVEVGGLLLPIASDFRTGIRFELLMQDQDVPQEEKMARALLLYYGSVPPHPEEAARQVIWFYQCGGKDLPEENGSSLQRNGRTYDFEEDAGYILAAFWSVYGIDLTTVSLHWWTFRGLFCALPRSCDFAEIMHYRVADTSDMSKTEKKRYEKLRKLYALKPKGKVLTREEAEREMLDYVDKRFAEMEKMTKGE